MDYRDLTYDPRNNEKEPSKSSKEMREFFNKIPPAKPWRPDCNKCEELDKAKHEAEQYDARRRESIAKFEELRAEHQKLKEEHKALKEVAFILLGETFNG
jgi:hypothetical protein